MMRMGARIDAFVKDDGLGVEKLLQGVVILRIAHMHDPGQPDGRAALLRGDEFAQGDLELDGVGVRVGDAGVGLGRRGVGGVSEGGAIHQRKRERAKNDESRFPH